MIKIIESIKYKPYNEIKHIIDKRIDKALNDGSREEIVAGRFIGREEGLIEGEAKGIDKKNIEISKNLLNKNIDVDIISETTELTVDEINDIK